MGVELVKTVGYSVNSLSFLFYVGRDFELSRVGLFRRVMRVVRFSGDTVTISAAPLKMDGDWVNWPKDELLEENIVWLK